MTLSLHLLAKGYLDVHTNDEIAIPCGTSASMVEKWRSGDSTVPLKMLQRMIDTWGMAAHASSVAPVAPISPPAVDPYFVAPKAGSRVAFCIPMSRRIGIRELGAFARMFMPDRMKLITEECYDTIVTRNRIAARALASDCEWFFWMDDDMIPQCGDAEFWYAATGSTHYPAMMAGLPTIGRLLFHGQRFIGGAYFSKDGSGIPMWSTAKENSSILNSAIAAGPHEELQEVKWMGFGCALVHRSVFEDVAAKVPSCKVQNLETKPHLRYTHGFFDKIDDMTDDASFCHRAREAGHRIFCDLSVMPAHLGQRAWTNR